LIEEEFDEKKKFNEDNNKKTIIQKNDFITIIED
jgi:hypothetical protein